MSLSASYIGLPSKMMKSWENEFPSDRKCSLDKDTGYFECQKLKSGDGDKIITFVFDGAKVSFTLSDLILEQHKKRAVFNIKATLNDSYAILGEPLFQKYFTVLDYAKNKIGLGPPRTTEIK